MSLLTQSHVEQFVEDAMKEIGSGKSLCLGRQLVPVKSENKYSDQTDLNNP